MTALSQGWARPAGARCWHFFVGVDAICRLYYHWPAGALVPTPPNGARRCKLCVRRLGRQRAGGTL
jgi:hypothetical protein